MVGNIVKRPTTPNCETKPFKSIPSPANNIIFTKAMSLQEEFRFNFFSSGFESMHSYRKIDSSGWYGVKSPQPMFVMNIPNPSIPSISGNCINRKATPHICAPINKIAIRSGTESMVVCTGINIRQSVHMIRHRKSNANGCDAIGQSFVIYFQLN